MGSERAHLMAQVFEEGELEDMDAEELEFMEQYFWGSIKKKLRKLRCYACKKALKKWNETSNSGHKRSYGKVVKQLCKKEGEPIKDCDLSSAPSGWMSAGET